MLRLTGWRLFSLIVFLAIGALLPRVAQADTPANGAAPSTPTLRVYGRDGREEGPGDTTALDLDTNLPPEDPPYTDLTSIFDPKGPQAPRKDSVTWNPVWMYEDETLDENQIAGLYHQMFADGTNISEKVWFRHWYEPQHLDKDQITYPAIMEEFSYILMAPDRLAATPGPINGPAGRTQFVFPVGMRQEDFNDPFGYGLTSLDADFDCVPDIVQIDSEATLAALKTGVQADFNNNGVIDRLDEDGKALSGDEVVILSIPPKELHAGGKVQFLDHMVEVVSVTNSGVTVRIWYLGDLTPVNLGEQTLAVNQMWTYKTRFPGVPVPPVMANDNIGPFYVQVIKVDSGDGLAQIRVGRALGAPFANVEAGDPNASLKRFYVDGHEYNVVAIATAGNDNFRFITLRTPVPKVPVTLKQHSVHLQSYEPNRWLSVLPPYNYEHYIIKDVQREQTGRVIGDLIGPVAPILPNPALVPYRGACPPKVDPYYANAREMRFVYVKEEQNPQYIGQLLEIYSEKVISETEVNEFWHSHQWETVPNLFTEFLLPDIAQQEDLYLFTSAFTAPQAVPPNARVQFWFDPATSDAKYKSPAWLRAYGEDSFGPGNTGAVDRGDPNFPVEVFPYTDPVAPFDLQVQEVPRKDFITFNPAFMSEFQSQGEDLQHILYPRISIAGHDALEKVWFRQWYEPDHLDKILTKKTANTEAREYRYPAVMQEFTYMFLDTKDQPSVAVPGTSAFAFPVGATLKELQGPGGFGLTTFDANFDGINDNVVRIHSEATLQASTGITVDFDGDKVVDTLDVKPPMNGDEMVVFSVGDLTLTPKTPYAMFLDHMVQLVNVTPNGQAQIQIWDTGGDLERTAAGGYNIVPHKVGAPMPYSVGAMGVTGRDKFNVKVIAKGGTNSGELDGPWFVYVNDINTQNESVSVTIGRALGASSSAIDNGAGLHDFVPGDPWYLKRFFVDGHEYNVVAIRTHQLPDNTTGFKYITIRTPVPKVNFVNAEDSQKLEGYPVNSTISVLPPFNFPHSVAVDILDNHDEIKSAIGNLALRPPLVITIVDEAVETEFTGELKEVMVCPEVVITDTQQAPTCKWSNQAFTTRPDHYTAFKLPAGELYLLTSSWIDENKNRVKFWYKPGESQDLFVDPPVGPAETSEPVQSVAPAESTVPTQSVAPVQNDTVGKGKFYIVKRGDTLNKIAAKFGTSTSALVRLNHLRSANFIYVGQKLIVAK